jgi:hypothetical protein
MASVIVSLPVCYMILFLITLLDMRLSPYQYIIYITVTGTVFGLLFSKYFLKGKLNEQLLLIYNRLSKIIRVSLGILGLILFTGMLLSIVICGALYFRQISS